MLRDIGFERDAGVGGWSYQGKCSRTWLVLACGFEGEIAELYVLLEGRGRVRVDGELLELDPLDALLVEPDSLRQLFNDTEEDALWLVVGAPREAVSSTLEMSEETLRSLYPEGPRALPPELGGGEFSPSPADESR